MDTPVMADQIGRHGSLMLMKRTEPNTVLTGFGIDTDELTFGSSINCDVRLYFDDVASLHCKIVFPEKKAFLVVMGAAGVLLDGDRIRPTMTNSGMQPTTVAMQNNSEIVVHGKHFRFAYPPKEMRPMLYATPPRADRRALRLSMIESARVFSPRPSPIPAENLRVLKSPIKRSASPMKPTPLHQATSAEDEDEEDIVLVDGNHPRVVEEDKDLVILEDVVRKVFPEGNPFSGTPMRKFGGSARTPQAPHLSTPTTNLRTPQPPAPPAPTPARRPRASLHRGVLLRNAHRAAMRQEMEEEERHEEEEVFGTVVAGESDESEGGEEWEEEGDGGYAEDGQEHEYGGDGEEWEGGDAMDVDAHEQEGMHHGEKDYDSDDSYDDEDEDGRQGHERGRPRRGRAQNDEVDHNERNEDTAHDRTEDAPEEGEAPVQDKSTTKTLGWRKSLERLWPFRSLSPEKEKVKDEEQGDASEKEKEIPATQPEPEHAIEAHDRPAQAQVDEDTEEEEDEDEANEQPAPLATPMKRAPPSHAYYTPQAARPTFGLGTPSSSVNTTGVGRGIGRMSLGGGPPQRMPVKTPWKVEDIVVSIPPAPTHTPQPQTQTPMRGRPSLSEAERRAIRERRQSARNAPDDFMGRVPGMTPGRTKSTSPVKERRPLPAMVPEEAESSTAQHHRLSTPLGQPGILGQPTNTPLPPDTRGLLDRMMSTIEDLKERRRQSLAASPIKPARPPPRMEESEEEEDEEEEEHDKENVQQKEVVQEKRDEGREKESTKMSEDHPTPNDDRMRTSEDDGSEEEWERLPAPPTRGRPASPVKPLSGRPASPVKPPSTSQASTSHPAPPQTPNMKGIREMFMHQKQRGLGTPAVEAVGEMFAPLEAPETPVPGPPETPSTGETVTPSTGELEADDEATPGERARDENELVGDAPAEKPKSGRVMKGKGKKAATEESQPPAVVKKATRAKAAETPATRTRATRASSKQPEPSDVEEEAPPPKTAARGRRAKQAEEDESTGEEAAPATRTRKGKAPASATKSTKTAAPPTIEEEPSSEEPAPRTRTRTRTRTTPTPEPEVQPKTTRTTRKTRTAPTPEPIEEEADEEAPKRTTRTRKATAVKREDSDEIAPLAGPSSEAQTTGKQLRKPTSRAKITPTAKAGASAAKAKAGTSAAKEKAAPRAESPMEKENTEEQAATKLRVTRRGGRKKVKEEEEDGVVTEPEPVVTRTRVTRSRATRT